MNPPTNALTFDLEDWSALVSRRFTGRDDPPSDRVVVATTRVLELLAERGTRATFFVLGRVAETYPGLIREIDHRGHEIGSHGHAHRRVDAMTAAEFRQDVARSVEAIEAACGTRPRAFRAPEFSITNDTPWAFDVLAELGFDLDSSVFPIRHRRYGIPRAPRAPYRVAARAGSVSEFPLATLDIAGQRIPAAGGGYLRLFPFGIVRGAIRQANALGVPAVIYLHPYEFDPLRLSIAAHGARARVFIFGQNLGRMRVPGRVRRLLGEFAFSTLGDVAAGWGRGDVG